MWDRTGNVGEPLGTDIGFSGTRDWKRPIHKLPVRWLGPSGPWANRTILRSELNWTPSNDKVEAADAIAKGKVTWSIEAHFNKASLVVNLAHSIFLRYFYDCLIRM